MDKLISVSALNTKSNVAAPYFETDTSGNIIKLGGHGYLGSLGDKVIGKSIFDLIAFNERSKMVKAFKRLNDGYRVDERFTIWCGSDRALTIRMVARPIYAAGVIIGFYGMCSHPGESVPFVVEDESTHLSSEDMEEITRVISGRTFKSEDRGVIVGSTCGSIRAFNPGFRGIIGYTQAELSTSVVFENVLFYDLEKMLGLFVLAGRGTKSSAHIDIYHKDRSIVHTEWTAAPIAFDGRIIGVCAYVDKIRDLYTTCQDPSDDLLRAFPNFIDKMEDPVLVFSTELNTMMVNETFDRTFGKHTDGQSLNGADIMVGRERTAALYRFWNSVIREDRCHLVPDLCRSIDGHEIDVMAYMCPIHSETGKVVAGICIFRDAAQGEDKAYPGYITAGDILQGCADQTLDISNNGSLIDQAIEEAILVNYLSELRRAGITVDNSAAGDMEHKYELVGDGFC